MMAFIVHYQNLESFKTKKKLVKLADDLLSAIPYKDRKDFPKGRQEATILAIDLADFLLCP